MPDFFCGPLPLVAHFGVFLEPPLSTKASPEYSAYIAQEPKAWPSHSEISYTFFDGHPNNEQEQLIADAIARFTGYANVNLVRTKADKESSADIRISFADKDRAWSAIGTDALKIPRDKPTMNLGFLSGVDDITFDKRPALLRRTLHEFGHAFGLAHEWSNEWTALRSIRNSEEKNRAAATQHAEAYGKATKISNFPEPDPDSVMVFPGPSEPEDLATRPDIFLSKKDIAWLTLNYPGRVSGDDEETGILKSLNDLEVPITKLSPILSGSTVSEIRFHYHKYISETHRDRLGVYTLGKAIGSLQGEKALDDLQPESHVLKGKVSGTTPLVDRAKEDDLYDSVAAAVLSPQFRQVIANAVPSPGNDGQQGPGSSVQPSTVEIQRGLLSILGPILGKVFFGIPGGAAPGVPPGIGVQHGFWGDIWDGLSSVLFGLPAGPGMISGTNPYNPAALPPHIEQGIFDSLTRFVSNPVFTNVVTGVIADVLQTHGIAAQPQGA